MVQTICNRCKCQYKPMMFWHETPGESTTGRFERVAMIFEIRQRRGYAGFQYVDLCPDCEQALLRWMEMGEEDHGNSKGNKGTP